MIFSLKIQAQSKVATFLTCGFLSRINGQTLAGTKSYNRQTHSVTIYRDRFEIPRIYGRKDEDVVFGLMYARAEGNFWQLEEAHINKLGRARKFTENHKDIEVGNIKGEIFYQSAKLM